MKTFVAAGLVALAVAGGASAELVARGASDGFVALGPDGRALVSYFQGENLIVARRTGPGAWRHHVAAHVARGSSLAAFADGVAGPAAVIVGPGERSLFIVQRRRDRWVTTQLERRLDAGSALGWPGLA